MQLGRYPGVPGGVSPEQFTQEEVPQVSVCAGSSQRQGNGHDGDGDGDGGPARAPAPGSGSVKFGQLWLWKMQPALGHHTQHPGVSADSHMARNPHSEQLVKAAGQRNGGGGVGGSGSFAKHEAVPAPRTLMVPVLKAHSFLSPTFLGYQVKPEHASSAEQSFSQAAMPSASDQLAGQSAECRSSIPAPNGLLVKFW